MKRITIDNIRKIVFLIFSVACLIAIFTCFIVNFAIDRQITWALYPLLSVPFGWLICSPLAIKKHGLPLALCSLMVFVLPYLFLLQKITPVGNWFVPIGLPSAVVGMVLIWIIYFLYRFLRISMWYKAAISVFLAGVVANTIINHYINVFLDTPPTFFRMFINIFPCFVVSILLGVIGYGRKSIVSENKQ